MYALGPGEDGEMVTCVFWGCRAPKLKPLSRECITSDFLHFESEARKWKDDSALISGAPKEEEEEVEEEEEEDDDEEKKEEEEEGGSGGGKYEDKR